MLSFGRNGAGPAWARFCLFSSSQPAAQLTNSPCIAFHRNTYHQNTLEMCLPMMLTSGFANFIMLTAGKLQALVSGVAVWGPHMNEEDCAIPSHKSVLLSTSACWPHQGLV
jgi:hypothetical protein